MQLRYTSSQKIKKGLSDGQILEGCEFKNGEEVIKRQKGFFKNNCSRYSSTGDFTIEQGIAGEHLSNQILTLAFQMIGFKKPCTRNTYLVTLAKNPEEKETDKLNFGIFFDWIEGTEFKNDSNLKDEYEKIFAIVTLLGMEDIKREHFMVDGHNNILVIDNRMGAITDRKYFKKIDELYTLSRISGDFFKPTFKLENLFFAEKAVQDLFIKTDFEERVQALVPKESCLIRDYYEKVILNMFTRIKQRISSQKIDLSFEPKQAENSISSGL